ncbi:MAG: ribosome small subunit-dependent GTPase A [Clostridia bacterium]
MHEVRARIIEILLDKYIAKDINSDCILEAVLRGNVKKNNNIVVGDIVIIKKSYDKYTIESIQNRKNLLVRPPVANIDMLVIVLSIDKPSIDYLLLDKELILCMQKNIIPLICINKMDLACNNLFLKNEIEYIKKTYENIDIVCTSIIQNTGIDQLKQKLAGKISAFSGNSGVGKSSITLNIIENKQDIEIANVALKTSKGRHTTKYVKLYEIYNNTYILDTPGFSSYELFDIEYKKLKQYYSEFLKCRCDYEDCSHVNEDACVCDVKRKIGTLIDEKRYLRYVSIYNNLKEKNIGKYR